MKSFRYVICVNDTLGPFVRLQENKYTYKLTNDVFQATMFPDIETACRFAKVFGLEPRIAEIVINAKFLKDT